MPIKHGTFMAHFGWRLKLDKWICAKFGHKPFGSNSALVGVFCCRCGEMADYKDGKVMINDEVVGEYESEVGYG